MTQNIRRVQHIGRSLLICIPDEIAKKLNINNGDYLIANSDDDSFTVRKLNE